MGKQESFIAGCHEQSTTARAALQQRFMMRKCTPLPELDESECLTPTGIAVTPFSEVMDDSDNPCNSSAPDLTNHPHLDSSMRSLSTSVASRRKEYIQKRREAESRRNHANSSLNRAERIAFMKRTQSVSTPTNRRLTIQLHAQS